MEILLIIAIGFFSAGSSVYLYNKIKSDKTEKVIKTEIVSYPETSNKDLWSRLYGKK